MEPFGNAPFRMVMSSFPRIFEVILGGREALYVVAVGIWRDYVVCCNEAGDRVVFLFLCPCRCHVVLLYARVAHMKG